MLSILTQFLSNRSQHVIVDGCWSKLVDMSSATGQCFGSAIVPPVHFGAFSSLENKRSVMQMITLMAVVPSPGIELQ